MRPQRLAVLERRRDESAREYDDNFQYTGSYSSLDMDDTYKIGFNAAIELLTPCVDACEKIAWKEEPIASSNDYWNTRLGKASAAAAEGTRWARKALEGLE